MLPAVCREFFSLFSFSPLLLRFILSAVITGVRPVELPLEVFILCDQPCPLLVHSDQPFPHEAVDHAAVEPHRHRRMGGPYVRVVIVHARIIALIALLAGIFLELEQLKDAGIDFLDPEHLCRFLSR